MEQIFIIREAIVSFYKRFETYLLIVLKFMVGLIVFGQIGDIGLYMPIFEPINSPPMQLPYTLLMATLFTVMTMTVGYGLIIINICIQTSAALGVMTFTAVFLLLILFFYARLAPKENFLILATFFAFEFGVPYVVPLLAGLYLGLTSVIPVSIGIMIVSFVPFFRLLLEDAQLMSEFLGANLAAMPEYFGDLYITIFSDIAGNQAWVFTAFIFSMVIFIVYIVSRFTIDYSKEIALGAGIVVTIISSIIAQLIAPANVSLPGVIGAVILSGLLAFLASFFDMVLDYQRTERVQFEDESNFYQVKITPKIGLSKKQRVLKRINAYDDSLDDYLDNDYPDTASGVAGFYDSDKPAGKAPKASKTSFSRSKLLGRLGKAEKKPDADHDTGLDDDDILDDAYTPKYDGRYGRRYKLNFDDDDSADRNEAR